MIHIALSFDKNYTRQFYALSSSIFDNNLNRRFTFHCIAPDFNNQEKGEFEEYVRNHESEIVFYSIDEFDLDDLKKTLSGHWTLAVYYRLLFPLMISSGVERLLYLDSDTIVTSDLSTLYSHEMDEYPLAAVYDCYVKKKENLGIHTEGDYFNSGVLLIDIKKWNKLRVSENSIDFLSQNPELADYVDQDALNFILKDNWKKMHRKYNLIHSYVPFEISRPELRNLISESVIIHYTMERPWHFLCKSRLRNLYTKYLRSSPVGSVFTTPYVDFSIYKIPGWLKIRLVEFYLDSVVLKKLWRSIKAFK